MGKSNKKAIKIGFHEGLPQIRANAGGMDIGASEVWVDVGGKDPDRFGDSRHSRRICRKWEIG